MRSAKFLTADLVYIYRPNLHVTDRRIAITEVLSEYCFMIISKASTFLSKYLFVSDLSQAITLFERIR